MKRAWPAAGVPSDAVLPNAQFAHSASDALQCLLDLKDGMIRIRQLAIEHVLASDVDPVVNLILDEDSWLDWRNYISRIEPFYWPARTAALVTAASASYPLELEQAVNLKDVLETKRAGGIATPPSYLPKRPYGICVFEQPCLFVSIDGRSQALSALAWNVGLHKNSSEIWLSLRGVVWTPRVTHVIWWSDGGSAEAQDNKVDATFRDERVAFTKWICTAAMFVDQEIVVASRADVSRAVRKRCDRAEVDTTCHVVTLRKELAHDHDSGGLGHVEWSHRWLVRGHWRRQWFQSRGGHAPVWIHPHVKGPSDKPFMEPKPTVFAVMR